MKPLITFILSILLLNSVIAQQNILNSYIEEGLDNNLALQQENLSLAKSLENLKQAKGLFMPDVAFNSSYTFAQGGRTIAIPIGDIVNPIYSTLNQLTESQQFPTDLPNSDEQLLPNRFHDTRIDVRQPLFNAELLHNYKANQSLVASQEARRDVYRQELTKEIKTGYYNYLTALEALEIYHSTEELLLEILRVNRKLVENDKATIDVVYRSEFEISDLRSQIAEAERLKTTAQSYFNFLLNRELSDSIQVDRSIARQFAENESIDLLQDEAITKREELDQLQYAIKANEQLYALNRSSRLPNLSLGASAGYQGFDYTFSTEQDYFLMQLNMSIPIFKGFRTNSKIQSSKLELQRLTTQKQELNQQIRLQVIEAHSQVKAANSNILAKQSALKSASKSFDIISRKYLENQITLLDLLDARTKFTNAQLELVVAKYDLLNKEALLERAIGLNH